MTTKMCTLKKFLTSAMSALRRLAASRNCVDIIDRTPVKNHIRAKFVDGHFRCHGIWLDIIERTPGKNHISAICVKKSFHTKNLVTRIYGELISSVYKFDTFINAVLTYKLIHFVFSKRCLNQYFRRKHKLK